METKMISERGCLPPITEIPIYARLTPILLRVSSCIIYSSSSREAEFSSRLVKITIFLMPTNYSLT